ncbi:MAG: hypothetical protein JW917_10715 [Ignavibacteria bacterium]|nr:hypothetical protein [Ignavibacteria bacterium]
MKDRQSRYRYSKSRYAEMDRYERPYRRDETPVRKEKNRTGSLLAGFLLILIIILIFLGFFSCSDPLSELVPPDFPETYLSVFSLPGDTVAPGATVKKISWWGDAPNGFIVGFNISFDSVNWGFTTKYDSTFVFTISGQDSAFRIWVASVDDKGLVDPTPATNLYPVINSPPVMLFDANTDLPDTIFPVATLKWTGTDPDGDFTIKNYLWSINDTDNFRTVPGNINLMTLTKDSGLVSGNYCLYMKAVDIAGAVSPVVRMPRDTSKMFFVREAVGRVLIIKDMPSVDVSAANAYFSSALDTILYSTLDIKSNNGSLIPKIVNPMFIETMKLFNVVIWSGNRGGQVISNDPNFALAQNSLPFYLASGGKVFWSSGIPDNFQGQGSLFNFAPVDSIKSTCYIQFNFPGDTLVSVVNGYPDLYVSQFIAVTRSLYYRSTAKLVYKLLYNPNRPYCLEDSFIAIKDAENNPKLMLLVMPIYFLDGNQENSKLFLNKLFKEFGLLPS